MQPLEKTIESSDLATLQEELERRYGPAVAQDIMDRLGKTPQNAASSTRATPDYMDVKAMSELQERFRAQAMMAIWQVKEWRKRQPKAKNNLVQMEGALLMRQCQDSIKLYRMANKTYHDMYRAALDAFSKPAPYHMQTSAFYASQF